MSLTDADAELVADLAEEYAARVRNSETPNVQDYVDCFPHLEQQIRQLFKTVLAVEELAPDETIAQAAAGRRSCSKSAVAEWALSTKRGNNRSTDKSR